MSEGSRSVAIPQALQIAFEHLEAGNLQKAQTILRQILEVEPDHADALHLLGIIGLQAGDFEAAREAIAKAVDLEPSNPYFLNSLGNAYLKLNRDADAESCFRRSVALAPEYFEAHNNLAAVLKRLGRLEEAERGCRQALALQPDYVEAHNNLANTLFEMGRLEEAEQCCDRALVLKPDYAEAHNNRGNVLWKLGRPDEAEPCYRKALVLRPDYAEAHSNLGNALFDMGRLEQAEQCYRRAFALKPDYARAHCNLANALLKMERVEEADQSYRRAIALQPDYPEAHGGLGLALRTLGRLEQAERSCRRAIELKPDHAEAHNNLGGTLLELGRLGDAERSYLQALALQPDHAEVHCNLGLALSHAGRLEDAERHYRRALELKPAFPEAHSNLIITLDLLQRCDIMEQQQERRLWCRQHARMFGISVAPHENAPEPGRRLRIGYVSADFHRHSACHIFAPVIRSHDRSAFEVIGYSGVRREDEVTADLRTAANLWRSTLGVSDEALADQIRRDRIDILVDLSGHTARNRLLVFARKPAPVQVTAWGYATGTGLEAIDYFFADPVLVPEEDRKHFAETVVDLPCCICYEAPDYAPAVSPLPSIGGKPFTFGCLNRIEKISDGALTIWARILAALPDSRLFIKDARLDDAGTRQQLLVRLGEFGMGQQQVRLLGGSSHAEHLSTYLQVDLALDPFPHGGGVSSMEALWMGVPVVTLVGSTTPSRLTASILTALDARDWIARSDDEYVRKAVDMAGNLPRLARIRKDLRTRMAASILGNVPAYTRAVESSYRTLWRRWCERPRP